MLESAPRGCKSENGVFLGLEFFELKNFYMIDDLKGCRNRNFWN